MHKIIIFLTTVALSQFSQAEKTSAELNKVLRDMDSRIMVDGKHICFFYADHNAANRCEAVKRCSEIGKQDLKPKIEAALKSKNLEQAISMQRRMANMLAYQEKTLPESLQEFELAYEMAEKHDKNLSLDILAQIGLVQMRLAEIKNCVDNHNEKSCIYPLHAKAVHKDKHYARLAAANFKKYLSARPDDDHIRWLYNIVHMAIGTYPKSVEKKYFIDHKIFESKIKFPHFRDAAQDYGIKSDESFGGVVIDDFNNDGFFEIVIGSINPCDPIRYYSLVDGKFKNIAVEVGIANQMSVGNIYQADVNNDGLLDMYITRGAWHPGGTTDPRIKQKSFIPIPEGSKTNLFFNTLLINKGNNKFEDMTEKSGLKYLPNSSLAAVWGDFNNDGWVDLFVCNEFREPDFFINQKGQFTEQSKKSGLINNEICKGTVAADVNNDGYLDIFLSNYYGDKVLYINNKDLTFKKSTDSGIKDHPKYAFTPFFFDYNNDGWTDLFIEAFPPNTDQFILSALGKKNEGEPSRLFKNKGDGQFEDVTNSVGLTTVTSGMSANFGDIDNDGYSEIFLGTGANGLGDLMPNLMFKNMKGKSFEDISVVGGFSSLQKGHGISFADVNNDGHTDVFIQIGGSSLADRFFPSLYMNPKNKNSWIKLKLEGVKSNKAALGARIKMTTDKNETLYHTINSGGSFGSNPLQANIGLGQAKKINEIKISWPSGLETVYKNVAVNEFFKVVEGEKNLQQIKLKEIPLPANSTGGHHHH